MKQCSAGYDFRAATCGWARPVVLVAANRAEGVPDGECLVLGNDSKGLRAFQQEYADEVLGGILLHGGEERSGSPTVSWRSRGGK